jgi:uncharacterized protein YndB with AHSA1/START domain
MACIHKEMLLDAPVDRVWAALRSVGDVHTRLARQFVVDTRLEGDSRLVTFADGTVVRERIIDIDESGRRLAYAIVDWQTTHHNASFQVFAVGRTRSRLVWIADLLPDTLADLVSGFMEQGCTAMTRTLERAE